VATNDPKDPRMLDAVLAKAATDRPFRDQLLSDPRTAIEREFGLSVPNSFRMKFIERGRDVDALVVLPDFQTADGELSEDELETIAGGADDGGTGDWANLLGGGSKLW
jgi:hypothetical protein